jgi:hypothetical protein
MSTQVKGESVDSLNFDAAEAVAGASGARTCTNCSSEITSVYHEANGQVVCADCRATLEDVMRGVGSGGGRFGRALIFGLIGAAVGSGIYYGVLALTGYEIGLIAIVVGWLVGKGVSTGANHRGGWLYQALAIGLTYVAIVSTYIPMAMKEGVDAPLVVMFIVSLIAPVAAGFSNIIGMAIIGFALYQAWAMNRKLAIAFTGPYQVKPAPSA